MKHLALPIIAFLMAIPNLHAEAPRALPAGQLPKDSRQGALRTLDDYFPFTKVASKEAWTKRAADLRRQTLVANGLWPMPTKMPLNAVVHGKVEREDYTVEKVYFQSMPGHFVTGSLYRPKNLPAGAKVPGVLCPHGHWNNGRFHAHSDNEFKAEMASGAEKFESGRHPLQARCVNLARMGCVVFHYDMIGYADSVQIEHRPGVREAMNTPENWGFFSPAAELRLQNMMGLQTYNSVRSLDFLLGLPDVDAARVGVTGASGGGTQTFILAAIDDRPTALFPAVMISTAMQGGCTCENAPYLRIGAGNIDLAALAAPRPLGMTAADDWTQEMESKGFPDLKAHYEMLGADGRTKLFPYLNFGHNYNSVSRHAMYGWFHEHLLGSKLATVEERPFKPLSQEEMSVWNAAHPKPKAADAEHERQLLQWWAKDANEQLAKLAGTEEYGRVVGGGWKAILGRELDQVGPVEWALTTKEKAGETLVMSGLLTATKHQEQIPALFLFPGERWNGEVVLWLEGQGKAALLNPAGQPNATASALVAKGFAVASIDSFLTGEAGGDQKSQNVGQYGGGTEAWQKAACYTFGYNAPLFVRRAHDVLTAVEFVRTNPKWSAKKIHLLGANGAGPIVAAAKLACGSAVASLAVDTQGFRFASQRQFTDAHFVPGAVKYGDLPGILANCEPAKLLVVGEPGILPGTVAAPALDQATVLAWITSE